MKIEQTLAMPAHVAYDTRTSSGLYSAKYVSATPRIAPIPCPTESRNPLVRIGAIGKVSSEPKFIETGMTGTITVPSSIKLNSTTSLFSMGIVNMKIITVIIVPKETSRVTSRNLLDFCRYHPQITLEVTPKTAVAPP